MDDTTNAAREVPAAAPLTLDDAAALLVQLEIGETAELERLQYALEELAFGGGFRPGAQAKVAGAARRVREAVRGGGDEGAAALRLAGELIEEAMNEGTPVAAPRPALSQQPARSKAERDAFDLSDIPAREFLATADPSLLGDFVMESREYMEGAEAALLELETSPENREAIDTVFRAFHTIKGTSGFLGLEPISKLTHHAESLFNRFREGEFSCTGPRADLSLRAVDMLGAVLSEVERVAHTAETFRYPHGYGELYRILENPDAAGVLDDDPAAPIASEQAPRLGDILVAQGKVTREKVEEVMSTRAGEPLGLALVRENVVSLADVARALRRQQKPAAAAASTADGTDQSVRIRTDRLDELINLMGELVIAQSMVAEDEGLLLDAHGELSRKVAHAGKIVRDLQELSVGLRMVPLKAAFQRMARLVRDVARKSGKVVELVTEGDHTEIDRGMVDVIVDPLVHMIRNAVDHGIEPPDVRESRGKPRAGTVRLAAYHAGGNVVVELTDDGKGLDHDGILRKAISKGLVESEAGLSESDVFNLIFAPGFSTAEQVTDLSGRGVGMDVVKRNVESLRGRIDIDSKPGMGSSFTIRLPLTLAVTDGMLVGVAAERYILPSVNIQMSFRPGREMISTLAGRGEMVLLRGELLPVVRLHRLFDVAGARHDPTEAVLVIIGFSDVRCALLVDELLGQQQVVARSLGEGIGRVPGVSGGAILGDGRVGLILDVSGIVELARETGARLPRAGRVAV